MGVKYTSDFEKILFRRWVKPMMTAVSVSELNFIWYNKVSDFRYPLIEIASDIYEHRKEELSD